MANKEEILTWECDDCAESECGSGCPCTITSPLLPDNANLLCPISGEECGFVIIPTRQPDDELVALKKFARKVIKEYGWDMEVLEVQDLAEELGLIVEHTATENDVDEESDCEVGDSMYKFSEILKEQE